MDVLYARNERMGILFLDPQGEFSGNRIAEGTGYSFDFHALLKTATGGKFTATRGQDIINISDVRLDGAELFLALLEREGIFEALGVTKKTEAIRNLVYILKDLDDDLANPWEFGASLAVFAGAEPDQYAKLKDAVLDGCKNAYAASTSKNQRKNFLDRWDGDPDKLHRIWDSVSARFAPTDAAGNPRPDLSSLLRSVMDQGRKVILDLSPGALGIEDKYKIYLMHFAFKRISQAAQTAYNMNGKVNCLVVLDEAGRFIPESSRDDEKRDMAEYITGRVKELRKFRVGFQFITQTVSEIQKDIYRALHYRIYGVGLAVGAEEQHIRDKEGKDAFQMYATLPDPRLSQIFSFMVCGVVVAMGTTGKPMYIEGFESDKALMQRNGLEDEFNAYHVTTAPASIAANGTAGASIQSTR